MWTFEREATLSGIQKICGVDEAGRGPLAGPVVAAAVILPFECELIGLNDSKKLSPKTRERLYDEIIQKAESYCIAQGSIQEIEDLNILGATLLTMQRAVNGLHIKPELVLIDGNQLPKLDINAKTIVKGDSKSASIAAASILAKVYRDRLMHEIDKEYPQYQFAKHKGYGTELHYKLIREYGVSPVHRPSFLKNILKENDVK